MVAVIQKKTTPRQRALVVDDSRIARHVLSGMLERRGFEVETADSAEAGLRRLTGDLPEVVFMDHLLPGMQGLEAVRKLRARIDRADMRIVMYTSQEGDLFADVARTAGADDVFVKTGDSRSLDTILTRLGLFSGGADALAEHSNVVPLPSARMLSEDSRSFEAMLAPILDRHRDRLRQDLLSEFAILERYEERMRRETMQRIDAMTRRALASIDHSISTQQRLHEEHQTRGRPTWRGMIAFAIALGVGLAAGLIV
jgi:CheY-like chemotaxis protein